MCLFLHVMAVKVRHQADSISVFTGVLFSVLWKRRWRRWPSSIATTTSSSCAPSDRTTCPSTTATCSDVSRNWNPVCPSVCPFVCLTADVWWTCSQRRGGLSRVRWHVRVLPAVRGWQHRWCCETQQAPDRHCHQLGRRTASRQEIRGLWVLLRQRHCTWHTGAPQVRISDLQYIWPWVDFSAKPDSDQIVVG